MNELLKRPVAAGFKVHRGTKIPKSANLFEVAVTYTGFRRGRITDIEWFTERTTGRNALQVQRRYEQMYGAQNPGVRVNVSMMDKHHVSNRPC